LRLDHALQVGGIRAICAFRPNSMPITSASIAILSAIVLSTLMTSALYTSERSNQSPPSREPLRHCDVQLPATIAFESRGAS
jgi:hypothetical protein